ncbi:hypothetical protein [Halobellus sp. H-GB7]|uniref:hypothetical protein n=1 Tax=Halobellus sp. H-GB7 TaxID=3069756 RepID=UPI0027AE2F5D|nr:hypothetical protein [Halobellus sp. H-GB7]MDQ2053226.1 hypothetical protein [Halobellus sp. H-GB7]
MADRWFVVPVATDDQGAQHPKYSNRDGVGGLAGNVVDFAATEWSSLDYPFVGAERYVVRLYADGGERVRRVRPLERGERRRGCRGPAGHDHSDKHPVAAGEPLRVDVAVTNAGDLAATGELTLSVSEQ